MRVTKPITYQVTLCGVLQCGASNANGKHAGEETKETTRVYAITCGTRVVAEDLARYRAVCRDKEPLDGRTVRVVSVEIVEDARGSESGAAL